MSKYFRISSNGIFVACEVGLSAALFEGKLPAEMENRCVAGSAHSQTK